MTHLLENDLYPQFANSFLLLIGKEQPELKTVYAKFSNEREPQICHLHRDHQG